jgi:hypothetical protein
MNGRQWIAGLLGPTPRAPEPTWPQIMDLARQVYGKGATRYLADQLGVTQRTAQRYLTGQHAPRRGGVRERLRALTAGTRTTQQAEMDLQHRKATAAHLRGIKTLWPPVITVVSRSSAGRPTHRRIGAPLTRVHAGLERVARLWEQGHQTRAQYALSDCVIARYAGEASDNAQGLAAILLVIDYPEGMDYT